jgi:antimicrobial peptide system SdpB family protein
MSPGSLYRAALRSDHRTIWFALGRTLLALATASELVFASRTALFHPVAGGDSPKCGPLPPISAFCVGDPAQYADLRYWGVVVALMVVASGYRPRLTCVLHLWATFSVSTSITLPDGGDAIALIIVAVLTPMCLFDSRRWHWETPDVRLPVPARGIAFVAGWALRLQTAYIYAHSAIAKMGVPEWQDGSAMYYITRDRMFGAAGVGSGVWISLTGSSVGVLALTWGALVAELVIAVGVLLTARWRIAALALALLLHAAIFAALGLFSFSVVMVALSVLVANPDDARVRPPVEAPRVVRSQMPTRSETSR